MPEQTLQGKVAIVTGSSRGIGAAIGKELSARGANVVLNYPTPAEKGEVDVALAALTSDSIAVEADMSQISSPQKLIDAALAKWNRIDILVNSVGLGEMGPLEALTLENWDRMVNLNGRGTFLMTQKVLPHLTKGSGRIVNITSICGRGAGPAQTIYAGTKGMIDSFTKCWAKELPPKYGCTVNAVSPGATDTRQLTDALKSTPEVIDMMKALTPVEGRLGQPDEVAYAVGFLCEERARFVNGEHMFVSGGLFID
ncbi:hypothetical protein N7492_005970 [Penicillium capsulatum]|uniref:Uncharacterized protein n=1 Tax=Penicillium capsulatum TaxID=69766 RepID=A0A9W9IEC2_9EURO|nr:hypothetical protein N7492_005970 [Penicillium capsulatum]KAJ6134927.1 hypothetical protein N7512_000087 [Penicillium capsulatum]